MFREKGRCWETEAPELQGPCGCVHSDDLLTSSEDAGVAAAPLTGGTAGNAARIEEDS